MMQDLGKRIRYVREKKGITLNAFANQLGVSSGDLSNLERGKTDNIELHLLEKIQKELLIFSMVPPDQEEDQITFRFNRAMQQFRALSEAEPGTAEYLLSTLENGLEHFLK
ncbi:helix-turn-helix domain-containing protein [Fictibacillus sp. KIGAM418]|uniref:Helix-turn-helix domain-containing protein n=1 Tax=Fictibacillus marinisediminis TaxID=2878389 RepID=A0A9X1XAV9_9BACL|nr:helix-turn-helix domain-containing protein [Fictibacillus marinisediminis]MCK6257346.1 helix-turn-helix domain-containing protein [Fictibacillus marinisediminis]